MTFNVKCNLSDGKKHTNTCASCSNTHTHAVGCCWICIYEPYCGYVSLGKNKQVNINTSAPLHESKHHYNRAVCLVQLDFERNKKPKHAEEATSDRIEEKIHTLTTTKHIKIKYGNSVSGRHQWFDRIAYVCQASRETHYISTTHAKFHSEYFFLVLQFNWLPCAALSNTEISEMAKWCDKHCFGQSSVRWVVCSRVIQIEFSVETCR